MVLNPTNKAREKEPNMLIIGCDYPGFQQIAFVDTESGDFQERRLQHREEAEKFGEKSPYHSLSGARGALEDEVR